MKVKDYNIPDEIIEMANERAESIDFGEISALNKKGEAKIKEWAIEDFLEGFVAFAEHKGLDENLESMDDFWMSKAMVFDLGRCEIYNCFASIEARDQKDGDRKWVISFGASLLGKDHQFYREPKIGNRSEGFIANTRFDSPMDCYSHYNDHLKIKFQKDEKK